MIGKFRHWLPAVAALLAVAALIGAACGDGDDDPEEDAPDNDTSSELCVEGAEDCEDTVEEPGERTDAPAPTTSGGLSTPVPCESVDAAICQVWAKDIAINDLASELGVEATEILVASSESVEWPDACLGISQPGIACAQVITPGFKIILQYGTQTYEYHTDLGRRVILVQ